MTPLVDAHAHIGASDQAEEIKAAHIVTIYNSTGADDLEATRKVVTSSRPFGAFFAGLHPNNPHRDLDFLRWAQEHADELDGVGEIGLDRTNDTVENRSLFLKQLALAERLGKPVCIHSRGKVEQVLEDLSSYSVKGVLLHWFEGDLRQLEACVMKGIYVSFGPPLLYSKKLRRLLAVTPIEKLLLETDSPVRYASCFEDRESTPLLVASVYLAAAFVLRIPVEELETSLFKNALNLLGRSAAQR